MTSPDSVGVKSETVEMLDAGEDTVKARASTNVLGDDSTSSVSCKTEGEVSTST